MTTSLRALEQAALRVVDDVRALHDAVVDASASIPLRRDELLSILAAEIPLIYAEHATQALLRRAAGRVISGTCATVCAASPKK